MRDYSLYLNDILTNIETAERFIAGISFEEFISDEKTNYAVVRCLEIIGEASKHIPAGLRNKYPAIPWKTIVGTRNAIIHEYVTLDLKEVWKTTKINLPPLKKQILEILADLTQ
jgi:uncharacterized protein with HEPN domain